MSIIPLKGKEHTLGSTSDLNIKIGYQEFPTSEFLVELPEVLCYRQHCGINHSELEMVNGVRLASIFVLKTLCPIPTSSDVQSF